MKIVFLGARHWHTPLYLDPALAQPEVEVVGITDDKPAFARQLGERLGCRYGTDAAALCDAVKPDLAFVLGRHADMPSTIRTLIERRIPMVVEKPAGLNAAEVRALADEARKAGVFVSVAMVFRSSGFLAAIREHAAGEKLLYADFKFIAGLPSRYHQADCEWVFDSKVSGGGTLINLGVHFIDLFHLLTSVEGTRLTDAEFGNLHGEGDVDDYVSLSLRNGDSLCRVETGYLYPAPGGIFDMHYSVRTEGHYIRTLGPGTIEISDLKGNRRTIDGTTTNMPIYPTYVPEVIDQVRTGKPPIADLGDMADIMEIVDQAYRSGSFADAMARARRN